MPPERPGSCFATSLVATLGLLGAACGGPTDPVEATGLGSIDVAVATTGGEFDPDGYQLRIDGTPRGTLSAEARDTIQDVATGAHTVELTGVANNCGVTNGASSEVTVIAGATAVVRFEVTCTPVTGAIQVAAVTSGNDLDPNGYDLDIDGSTMHMGVQQILTVGRLTPGEHTVTLGNVADNCTLSGPNQVKAAVIAGVTEHVAFQVHCTGASIGLGAIQVTVRATIILPPPNFQFRFGVTLDGGNRQSVEPGGSVTYSNVSSGTHVVGLDHVPGFCSPGGFPGGGSSPVTVNVTAGTVTPVSFSVFCIG
jgi:hypothetical protein